MHFHFRFDTTNYVQNIYAYDLRMTTSEKKTIDEKFLHKKKILNEFGRGGFTNEKNRKVKNGVSIQNEFAAFGQHRTDIW